MLVWFGVSLLFAGWFASGWFWRGRWERRTRARRRGGFVKPPASARMRDGGLPTPETAITARISSYSLRGPEPEAWDFPRWPPLRSRLGARGSSGNVTAARGASGEPLGSAASADRALLSRMFVGGGFTAW